MILWLITLKKVFFYRNRYLEDHPDTPLGQPGRFQGLNVGIVLYRLDRMRSSFSYQSFLSENGTGHLANKYRFTETHLGAQDWLTLVLYEDPDLIFALGCRFNFQVIKIFFYNCLFLNFFFTQVTTFLQFCQ
jgi:hypothetical protein